MDGDSDDELTRTQLSESLLARALATVSEGSLITDADQNIVYANPAFTTITGYTEEEVLGLNCRFLQGEGTEPETISEIRRALASGETFQGNILNVRKNGRQFWNALTVTPLTDARGNTTHFASVLRDTTMNIALQNRSEVLLEESERQRETGQLLLEVARSLGQRSSVSTVAQTLADAVPVVCRSDRSSVALWDSDSGRLVIAAHSGWSDELAGEVDRFETTPDESPELARLLTARAPILVNEQGSDWARATLDRFQIQAFAAIPIVTDGQIRGLLLAHWASTPPPSNLNNTLRDRLVGLTGLAAMSLDNTALFEKVAWDAEHDSLTALPNRALLEKTLVASLGEARAEARRVAVIFCDIDRLKRANDSLGHHAGDAVVRHVAQKLQSSVRDGDLVARLSGDEFVIVLPNVSGIEQAEPVAERIRQNLLDPLVIAGRKLFVKVSQGIAISDAAAPGKPDSSLRAAAELLITRADADMYRTKAGTRGGPAARPEADELRLDSNLHGATGRGEIVAFYQPQIDLASGNVVAVEALARWRHPELGLLPPDVFIPIAEENGLIHEIGESILVDACRLGAIWHERGIPLEVAVNVSAAQLEAAEFFACVDVALATSGLPAASLTLEITESQLVADSRIIHDQLRRLRELGVGISVDDFGTGYSSLTQLLRFPVSELKIDRAFVQSDESTGSVLVTAVVSLSRGLGFRVVAEGVETVEQLNMVRDLGCDRAQGFVIAQPLSAEEFEMRLPAL